MNDWSLRLAQPADAAYLPAIERSAARAIARVEGLKVLADRSTMLDGRLRRLIAMVRFLLR